MKYFKESTKFPGVKEYYEVTGINISTDARTISAIVNKYYLDDSGFLKNAQSQYNIKDPAPAVILDPNWNSSSTPPKPDGFVLSDPTTWAGLAWEQIPMVNDYSNSLFTKYLENFTRNGKVMDSLQLAIFYVLIENKNIPARSEGWNFSDGVA